MSSLRRMPARSIDILVVDDSAVVRQSLKTIIESQPAYRVLIAADPYEAVAVMSKTKPRAILLDVDMPRMDGLTFLRKLMRQHTLPVLLVTDHPGRGVAALELGAIEVIAKPDWRDPDGLTSWADRLHESLRFAVTRGEEKPKVATEARYDADAVLVKKTYAPTGAPTHPVIAIGASTGGVEAISRLLSLMPRDAPGLVIVQHMRHGFTTAFSELLAAKPNIAMTVREARHGETIQQGTALIVPEDTHGVIRRSPGNYWIELMDGPPVCRFKPSVDVLFRSAAQAAGPRAAGVILTGMLDDGAGGLLEMFEAGCFTIAQDEHTSEVFGMNKEAIRRGAAKRVLALDRIPGALSAWAQGIS